MTHPRLAEITERIMERSDDSRRAYLQRVDDMRANGPMRGDLSCSNLAHGVAACSDDDKQALKLAESANIGIINAYNDMLSAHQPLGDYPDLIKRAAHAVGCTAQVAGGVPAMCDGVTQGAAGMELSLFSRDIIAAATAIALSHNMFDAALCLGVCDKIVPGMLIGALSFGHLPVIFAPAGPMTCIARIWSLTSRLAGSRNIRKGDSRSCSARPSTSSTNTSRAIQPSSLKG